MTLTYDLNKNPYDVAQIHHCTKFEDKENMATVKQV